MSQDWPTCPATESWFLGAAICGSRMQDAAHLVDVADLNTPSPRSATKEQPMRDALKACLDLLTEIPETGLTRQQGQRRREVVHLAMKALEASPPVVLTTPITVECEVRGCRCVHLPSRHGPHGCTFPSCPCKGCPTAMGGRDEKPVSHGWLWSGGEDPSGLYRPRGGKP